MIEQYLAYIERKRWCSIEQHNYGRKVSRKLTRYRIPYRSVETLVPEDTADLVSLNTESEHRAADEDTVFKNLKGLRSPPQTGDRHGLLSILSGEKTCLFSSKWGFGSWDLAGGSAPASDEPAARSLYIAELIHRMFSRPFRPDVCLCGVLVECAHFAKMSDYALPLPLHMQSHTLSDGRIVLMRPHFDGQICQTFLEDCAQYTYSGAGGCPMQHTAHVRC